MPGAGRVRDLALLDALDASPRVPFAGRAFCAVRAGRDPLTGAASRSRWCDGSFDVLYTSLVADGAIAEIEALLASQPIRPSNDAWTVFEVEAAAQATLEIADTAGLARFGVDVPRYTGRDHTRTREIAEAAHFLGFDGLLVPSARYHATNLVLFTGRIPPDAIRAVSGPEPIDFAAFRRTRR